MSNGLVSAPFLIVYPGCRASPASTFLARALTSYQGLAKALHGELNSLLPQMLPGDPTILKQTPLSPLE